MRETSLGNLLRETRVGKHITLDDIESNTGISSHYLLAMELDQFKIIPEEKFYTFLKQYADIVDLDFDSLSRLYQLQISSKKQNQEPSVTQIVEEKLSKKRTQEKQFTGVTKAETLVIPVKTVGVHPTKPTKTIPPVSRFKAEEKLLRKDSEISRLSRYGNNEKKKKSALPVTLLSLISLAIVGIIFFAVWRQFENTHAAKPTEMSFLETNKEENKAASESTGPKTKIQTEGAENYLTATITKSKETVDITVALTDAQSSWISITNTEIGEGGITLSKEVPSYSTTLSADVTESLLTLGVTKGVSITIDGQPLDLSAITSTDLSYITLKIQ